MRLRLATEIRSHRILLLASVIVLSTMALSSSPLAVAQMNTWTQTTREDFAGGTSWNIDKESSPGNLTLPASATSWIESSFNPGLRGGPSGSWDDSGLAGPVVLKENGMYKMWYAGDDTGSWTSRIGYSISSNGVNWTKPKLGLVNYKGSFNNNIVIDIDPAGTWENSSVVPGTVIRTAAGYDMWYSCRGDRWAICRAHSSDGLTWSRYGGNPVLGGPGSPSDHLFPAVIQEGSTFRIWYAVLNSLGHHEMWTARSDDGFSWNEEAEVRSIGLGESGSWFDGGIIPGTAVASPGDLLMWYSGIHGSAQEIGLADSIDGVDWSASRLNPIVRTGMPGTWDSVSLSRPSVLRDGGRYRMWFAGFDGSRWTIGTAASAYGERPVPPRMNPVVPLGTLESWDSGGMFRPSVVFKDGIYHMWYTGSTSDDGSTGLAIGYARSSNGVDWEKPVDVPILQNGTGGWDSEWVGLAWVVWDDASSMFRMWYTGSDGASSRIGLASSPDGLSWQKNTSNPVTLMGNLTWFDPSDARCPWVGEDPDRYVMYAGTKGPANVSIARLSSWDKGLTWLADEEPLLAPSPGSWEGDSVSCPVLAKNET